MAKAKALPKEEKPVEKPAEPPVEPVAQAAPEPVAAVTPQGCEAYRSLVSQYDWDVHIALAVMEAESSCRADATNSNTNGSVDRGLFQVNSVHSDMVPSLGQLFDPATNVATAYRIYTGSGWRAWNAFTAGRYLQFL